MDMFKKIFAPAYLGRWAFFSMLLAVLGTWSAAAWMTLAGVLFDFSKSWKLSWWFIGIFFILTSGAAVCNLAFFYSKVPGKFRKYFLLFCAVSILAAAAAGAFYGKEIAFYTALAAFFWILPLAVFHKKSYWVIPGSACWTIFFLSCGAFYGLMQNCYKLIDLQIAMLSTVTANVAFSGFFSMPGAIFCLAKLYSDTDECKKILFFPSWVLLIIFAISWGAMSAAAFHEERIWQKNIIRSGKFFGFSLDAAGLRQIYYYRDVPPDPAFWKNFEQQLQKFRKQTAMQKQDSFVDFPGGHIEKRLLHSWKNTIESSSEIKELEKNFPEIIPPKFRNYKKYYLFFTILDDISLLYDFTRIQIWRLRFALEKNDTATALEALNRINKSIERLNKDHIAATHGSARRFLAQKQNALELLIESGKLSQQELIHQIDTLAGMQKKLTDMEHLALGGETVFYLDFLEGLWQGEIQFSEKKGPQIKVFGCLFPQISYIFRKSCNIFIKKNIKKSFKEIDTFSPSQYLFSSQSCHYAKISNWYTDLKARCIILETLLKLALEKQRSGSYPDKAPEWLPSDPFTGRKLHYKKGDMPITEYVYAPVPGVFRPSNRTVKAVAVWSEGINAEDDRGLYSRKRNGPDDLRTMIRL